MKLRLLGIACLAACLWQASQNVLAQSFNSYGAGPTSDNAPSMGQFSIVLNPAFSGAFNATYPAGSPGYTASTNRFISPVLNPNAFFNTTINRSAVQEVGSAGYTGGVPVGSPSGLVVSNASISQFPTTYTPPAAGTDMVFTQIGGFSMTDASSLVTVAVGASAGDPNLPNSVGEVISNAPAINGNGNASNDFPAQSFFDVFVDITIPSPVNGTPITLTNATVYNGSHVQISNAGESLVVADSGITGFPPTAIYIHGGSSAAPVFIGAGGIDGNGTDAGDVLGMLLLAGHGVLSGSGASFSVTGQSNTAAFSTTVLSTPELPVPLGSDGNTPPITFNSSGGTMTNSTPDGPYSQWGTSSDPVHVVPEPASLALAGAAMLGLGGAVLVRRRRRGTAWRGRMRAIATAGNTGSSRLAATDG